MIYESSYVLRSETNEETIAKIKDLVKTTIADFDGEIIIEENWGVKTFAQATEDGETRGNYFYVMYKSNTECNNELQRRFRISEDTLKFMLIKLGVEDDEEKIKAAYKNPALAASETSMDLEKEKKMFSKRKSCYFSAKKCSPDWKDPSSYAWLVNEFGKISPSRVTGLRPKHQRAATTAIKRGRCMGLISYLSNHVAR